MTVLFLSLRVKLFIKLILIIIKGSMKPFSLTFDS